MPKIKLTIQETIQHERIVEMTDKEYDSLQEAEDNNRLDEHIGSLMNENSRQDGDFEDGEFIKLVTCANCKDEIDEDESYVCDSCGAVLCVECVCEECENDGE